MLFPFVEGDTDLKYEDIVYIDTSGRRSVFHTKDGGSYHLYRKLNVLEEQLQAQGFIRCHRCYLINMRYVKSIKYYLVTLTTGEIFSVSRARYGEVKRRLLDHSDLS